MSSPADEALYGGAAGGGKSDALLLEALRYKDHPDYRALLLRRTMPELRRSLWPRSFKWFPGAGGRPNEQKFLWSFPSGARIEFGHLQHETDLSKYQSAEYQYIAFDELTTFTRRMYEFMRTRLRSSSGIPTRIRAGTNPGNEGHEWVLDRWRPWLDTRKSYKGPRAGAGQILYFFRETTPDGERDVFVEPTARRTERLPDGRELQVAPLSRTFVPALPTDNPHLLNNDPSYIARLMDQDVITRAQLLRGDFLIRAGRGILFKRGWFRLVELPPARARRVRFWDRAATEENEVSRRGKKAKDPDWTVGARLGLTPEGLWTVEHVVRFRGRPEEVERTIVNTAKLDGPNVQIGLEQEPGGSGKFEAAYYVRTLRGYNVTVLPATKDKVTRARPVSSQVEHGNFQIVRGPWNEELFLELEGFPEWAHDDQVDAISGAFAVLTDDIAAGYDDDDEGGGGHRRM